MPKEGEVFYSIIKIKTYTNQHRFKQTIFIQLNQIKKNRLNLNIVACL